METKIRITVTLDHDVGKKLADIAECQRKTVSALVNEVLAEKLGLVRKMK